MKKNFKLVLALVLVALLTMTTALAATITVTQDNKYADADKDYHRVLKYVKVFNAELSTEAASHTATNTQADPLTITDSISTGVSYYLDATTDAAWITALSGTGDNAQSYFTLTPNADSSRYYVTAGTISDMQAAAQWLYAHKPASVAWTDMTYTAATESTASTWTATLTKPAYVLIASFDTEGDTSTEALATNLVAATTDISIVEKNSYPTVDKKQRDGTSGDYTNDAVKVKVGDLIDYEVTVTVPADASLPIHVTDTMSSGLEFVEGSMLIKVGDADATATATDVTSVAKETGDTFTWKYDIAATANTKGKTIVFTFQGRVTEAAIVDTGKKNDVDLQYGNTSYHIPDSVDYKVYATGALKFDGDTATVNSETNALEAKASKTIKPLDGAHFKLQVQNGSNWDDVSVIKDGNYYRPLQTGVSPAETAVEIITPATGDITIRGLDQEKTYRLYETQAPEGYNLMNPVYTAALSLVEETKTGTPVEITDPYQFKIANNKGGVLPSTGGIGTTIFYIGGSILVLAAAILLITKRRMSSND